MTIFDDEIEFVPQGISVKHEKGVSWGTFWAWLLFIAVIVATTFWVHYSIEQKIPFVPKAEAAEKPLSDFQQERRYCAMALAGVQVAGGTMRQIQNHCAKYITNQPL